MSKRDALEPRRALGAAGIGRSQRWGALLQLRWADLLDWRPAALMGVCAALIVLCSQAPLRYDFEVGRSAGPESDAPFLQGFYPAEGREQRQSFRWTKAQEARIEIPGIGRRGVVLDLDIVSHRAQWDKSAPPTPLTIQSGQIAPVSFTLRLEGAHYQLYLPPEALSDGALRLDLRTPVWPNQSDTREELGIALGKYVKVATVRGGGLIWPDSAMLLGWPLCIALWWVALWCLRFPRRTAMLLLLPLALGPPLLQLLDAPRLGFASQWALQFGGLGLAGAIICALGLPPLLQRLRAPAPASVLRWLGLLVVLSFALKYGGRLYPESMPGDLQLHINRYGGTISGQVFIRAQHRGLPFPFPTGPYLLLAPLTLLGIDIRLLLQLSAGIFEASTVLLLYLMGARALGRPRIGMLAGAIYAITSAGFMTSWFAFETQVTAQWFSLVLLALLMLGWPRYHEPKIWWPTVLLLAVVFLGHIGLFINITLLGLLAVPLLWWRARDAQERRAAIALLLAGLSAVAFAMLFFYSGFSSLIIEQLGGVASGGLNGATGRNPIPRETTLWVTWQGGLITHYGFFPVLLLVPGLLAIAAARLRRSALPPLLWLTLLVSISQAVLPLITLSSITTRWLMFSAWAIAVAGALGLSMLWRRGRGARVATIAMSLYVGWLTVAMFIEAMAQRKAPIEPF